jgi:hypothetical protein
MAKKRETAMENSDLAKPIKDVESGKDGKTLRTPEHDQNSPVIGEALPRQRKQVFLKGEDRKRRRRLDLKTLHGTARESARVYRELAEGRITLEHAEVRSRVLGRHRDILAALKQSEQLEAIQAQLRALRGDPPQQLLIDESQIKVSE